MGTLTFRPGLPISPWRQDVEEGGQGQRLFHTLPPCATGQLDFSLENKE